MPPRHPSIARALGSCRGRLAAVRSLAGPSAARQPGTRQPSTRPAVGVHVACSGGPDSVALVGLLGLLAPKDGLRLSVGHVDHGLRPESAHEAALVQRLAEDHGLPCAVTRLHLPRGPGLPARAREARRDALRQQARQQRAAFVALGHTATDQAETILLHLARGAGLEGLAAMAEHDPWDDGAPGGWLRPLLELTRAETRALCLRLRLPFVDDPTNAQREHPRVWVRHELLPGLRELNPRVEQALARTAAHARAAEDALGAWADRELRARRRGDGSRGERRSDGPPRGDVSDLAPCAPAHGVPSGPRWSTEGMEALPSAVRTRLVRRVCRSAGAPDDALSASTIASIDDALACPGRRRSWDLHPFLRLHLADGELWTEDVSGGRTSRPQPLTPS